MEYLLFCLYLIVLIYLVFLLVHCCKNGLKWKRLFVAETAAVLFAAGMYRYFENLPGTGFMPGLTYLMEILISFVSMLVFLVVLAGSILCCFFSKRK